ncbi:guanine nucleotide-binding protein g(o) subunit alpha [Anaeramoeba ignava]|uniref:Guanine nucleotide-binding protein g(O) subunit alpha n=1 Tax=Anaeramoeba ignava TaxID=1746090 RepID=A0A9Q0LT58_ANAIG|nr:guanine nucleotide-binding protein g(o) subunit alpha [Anaeramoeba ignava]
MGNCCKNNLSEDEQALMERDKTINSKIKKESKTTEQTKILLLGAGESGKTTFFKQLKLLERGTFTNKEKEDHKQIIYQNCFSQMKALILVAQKLGIPIENSELATNFQKLKINDEKFTRDLTQSIKELWKDPGIQKTYELRDTEFQLNETADYFFNEIDRIGNPDYIPTNDDILRARLKTVSIEEVQMEIFNSKFTIIDVGGQRNERRKWLHCFDKVTYIFKEKILRKNLKDFFPEYSGPEKDKKTAYQFIQNQFEQASEIDQTGARSLYTYKTCAIDTRNIERIFHSISDTVFRKSIKSVGLI